MNKAFELGHKLEQLSVDDGMREVERANLNALHFDVMGDSMCIMHNDGSVSMIESMQGVVMAEAISPANILKVLHHYRPFKEVFKGQSH